MWLLALLPIGMGALLGAQTAINAKLRGLVGSPYLASTISFTIGTAALAIVAFSQGALVGFHWTRPWWLWLGGLDDVRAFNFVDYPTIRRVDIYATRRTLACVRKDFDYAFAADKYRGVPEIELREIDPAHPFRVKGVEVVPVSGHHSPRFEVTGYRIGRLAYLTDFKSIDEGEVAKLAGVEVLVVNALRAAPHDSHFNVAEALELIRRVGPREAYLTHMSHEMGLHAETEAALPEGVHPAWDGLQVEIEDPLR